MWRTSPISRAITSARISSGRKSAVMPYSPESSAIRELCRSFFVDIPLEIFRETFRRRRQPGIFGEMIGIGGIKIGQSQRPRPALRDCDGLDVKARQGAGGK